MCTQERTLPLCSVRSLLVSKKKKKKTGFGMRIVNSVVPPTLTLSPPFLSSAGKGGEAAGTQRLSKSKKWYCHTSRMAVWCLFKRGGKEKKTGPGNWIVTPCQYVLALPPPSLQQHVLFSASLFSVTHIPEPCAAQLSFRSLKHEAEWPLDTAFSCTPRVECAGKLEC